MRRRNRGISAAAFMAGFSAAGRIQMEPEYEPEPHCECIRRGDFEDTRGCPAHGEARPPAVKLAMDDGPEPCPF